MLLFKNVLNHYANVNKGAKVRKLNYFMKFYDIILHENCKIFSYIDKYLNKIQTTFHFCSQMY